MNLFELFVKIGVDDQASGKISNLTSKLGSGLATAAKVGAAAITAVTAATTAMSAALIKGVSQTAEYGDNIDKMSQKMGMTAEAYQEWDAVMQHCGTSIDSMQSSMKTLATAAESGSDAFERLGLSQEDIADMSQEELFGATITALQNVESETERTYLAGKLLGRGATELGALLNTSAEDTQAMKDRVHELGGVMSDEAVKAAAAYQDSLQDMKTAFSGLSRGLTSKFMPALTAIMDGLTGIFSGNGNSGIVLVTKGVSRFIDNINTMIPQMLETGKAIIDSLIGVIMENLPTLVSAGVAVVTEILLGITEYIPNLATGAIGILNQIVNSIVDNLPMLLTASLETIMALANGIAEFIPELGPAIIDVISGIANMLADPQNLSNLLDSALEIILTLASGLTDFIPQLIDAVFTVIDGIVKFLLDPENILKILDAALQIVLAIATGLINSIPRLIETAFILIDSFINVLLETNWGETGQKVMQMLMDGLNSMVSSFTSIGSQIVDSIKSGISSAWDSLVSWFEDLWDSLFDRDIKVDVEDSGNDFQTRVKASTSKSGSFKSGLDYVPYDEFAATLHKGERVLTAEENKEYSRGLNGGIQIIQYINSVPQTPVEFASATLSYFEEARWAF